MFGSDDFPLGPNGQFPRKRIANYGVNIIPPVSMQDTYLSGRNTVSKLPVLEKDFHSSVLRVKGPMRHGTMMRGGRRMFRPRYAPVALGQHEEEYNMDEDSVFDPFGHRYDEGETDDSVGNPYRMFRGTVMPMMRVATQAIGARAIRPATHAQPISKSARALLGTRPVVGSGGWMKGIQRLLGGQVVSNVIPVRNAVMGRGTMMGWGVKR